MGVNMSIRRIANVAYHFAQRARSRQEVKGSTTINHFYEKLLLLKDRMNTATGKAMAEARHRFMEEYLRRFFEEWEGG